MKKADKSRVLLVVGLLGWLIVASFCYAINGYLGILIVLLGAGVFYYFRRKERKEFEQTAPKEGLYVGFPRGVIYRTQLSIEECLMRLADKREDDPLEYDFTWDEAQRAGSLALYCKKGGFRPSNCPSSFVVSFSVREGGNWILVRYLDPNAKTSVMTRPDVDGFLLCKCEAKAIGMRKAAEE